MEFREEDWSVPLNTHPFFLSINQAPCTYSLQLLENWLEYEHWAPILSFKTTSSAVQYVFDFGFLDFVSLQLMHVVSGTD